MNSKYTVLQLVIVSIMIVAVYFFSDGLGILLSHKTYTLSGIGTTVVTVDEDQDYYIAFDQDYGLSAATDAYQVDNKNRIDFITGDAVYISIQNNDTNETYFISYYDNGSLIINNYKVIGSVPLTEGTYTIIITDATSWIAAGQTFQLIEQGFGYGLTMVIVMPIVLLISFIVFIVIRVRRKQLIEQETAFDGYTYQSKDINALLDSDDVWEEQQNSYNKLK